MISTILPLTQTGTLTEIYKSKMRSVGNLEPDLVYLQCKNKHMTITSIPFRIHTGCKSLPAIHVCFSSKNSPLMMGHKPKTTALMSSFFVSNNNKKSPQSAGQRNSPKMQAEDFDTNLSIIQYGLYRGWSAPHEGNLLPQIAALPPWQLLHRWTPEPAVAFCVFMHVRLHSTSCIIESVSIEWVSGQPNGVLKMSLFLMHSIFREKGTPIIPFFWRMTVDWQ